MGHLTIYIIKYRKASNKETKGIVTFRNQGEEGKAKKKIAEGK